jgi:hypothetical protein
MLPHLAYLGQLQSLSLLILLSPPFFVSADLVSLGFTCSPLCFPLSLTLSTLGFLLGQPFITLLFILILLR